MFLFDEAGIGSAPLWSAGPRKIGQRSLDHDKSVPRSRHRLRP
jgi:hypothetical protein